MSTKTGPGGLKATPSISACLDPNTSPAILQQIVDRNIWRQGCRRRLRRRAIPGRRTIRRQFSVGVHTRCIASPGTNLFHTVRSTGRPTLLISETDLSKAFDSWNNPHYTDIAGGGSQAMTTIGNQQYALTKELGGGVKAATNDSIGQSWDLLDSQGNKIGDGGYTQTRSLGDGIYHSPPELPEPVVIGRFQFAWV